MWAGKTPLKKKNNLKMWLRSREEKQWGQLYNSYRLGSILKEREKENQTQVMSQCYSRVYIRKRLLRLPVWKAWKIYKHQTAYF